MWSSTEKEVTVDISQTVVGEQAGQGWHAVPGEDNQDDGDADGLGTEHHPPVW